MQKPIVNISKVRGLLIPVVLTAGLGVGAGCSSQPTTSLAEIKESYGGASLELVANGQINVEFKVADTSGGCPYLSDDAHAVFDGIQMNVERGGYDTTSTGCYPIAFWISDVPTATAVTYESNAQASDMVIADTETTWTVSSTKMFSNDFLIDEAAGQITWQDVSRIVSATVYPGAITTISDNVISFEPGTEIQSVTAYAHPIPTVCDGPTICAVDLNGNRSYTDTNPQE